MSLEARSKEGSWPSTVSTGRSHCNPHRAPSRPASHLHGLASLGPAVGQHAARHAARPDTAAVTRPQPRLFSPSITPRQRTIGFSTARHGHAKTPHVHFWPIRQFQLAKKTPSEPALVSHGGGRRRRRPIVARHASHAFNIPQLSHGPRPRPDPDPQPPCAARRNGAGPRVGRPEDTTGRHIRQRPSAGLPTMGTPLRLSPPPLSSLRPPRNGPTCRNSPPRPTAMPGTRPSRRHPPRSRRRFCRPPGPPSPSA